jgi:hypothetical protein
LAACSQVFPMTLCECAATSIAQNARAFHLTSLLW